MIRPGTTFLAKLPAGYDDRTRLVYSKSLRTILIVHPDFKPGVLKGGEVVEIDA